eukprot:4006449-Amphidinium_carterae.1
MSSSVVVCRGKPTTTPHQQQPPPPTTSQAPKAFVRHGPLCITLQTLKTTNKQSPSAPEHVARNPTKARKHVRNTKPSLHFTQPHNHSHWVCPSFLLENQRGSRHYLWYTIYIIMWERAMYAHVQKWAARACLFARVFNIRINRLCPATVLLITTKIGHKR